ncbi:DUF3488 domain-containing transglutaminase family protein [Aestuariicella hydrocarbonica]|uniref:DUF3488 domain-containing transglutaminase family protein n=1 Tax=Pseudomaricurvus hydrocarbonicus TaxID=1470433 RepID=A0A9E5JW12_9GAMM|nr:DUF3488 and transglutaminase-like domain-containing protein [Aestuariicella hydrocarbonica]NHO65606.1 DUF3488 domain-containing transglutaminase family protein [Aestuariicella hydrocarbonica]
MTAVERFLLPRNSLLWLIMAQGLAIAPLLLELPVWLTAVWAMVLWWRLQEFRGHWPMPGGWVKALLVIVCVAGLLLSFGGLLGLEPMVALLVSALLLKQLEMQRRKDALVLVYLTFFLIGVQFLFSQDLLASVYGVVCVWCAISALLSMNQPTGHQRPWRSFRLAGRLVLHTVPLMILLFLIMPRIGSLWSVPNPSKSAKTGVSDSMSPGDFSSLSRSGGVAFRVSFEGEVPPQDQLYWRGLVFSDFDGRSWRQAQPFDYQAKPYDRKAKSYDRREVAGYGSMVDWQDSYQQPWRDLVEGRGQPVNYSIIMEASHQPWLYSLMLPETFEDSRQFGFARDFRLVRSEPVHQRLQYQVSSRLDYTLEADPLPPWRLRRELQLPKGFNPRTRETAEQWHRESGSDLAYIDRVLGHYRDYFFYTLEPPALGQNTVDEFLWQTQQGFCEHFASSFVVLMRAAGIPARVVAGYQGGEYNPLDNYVVVHQYDAHAWSEVWLPGRGWVRIDPTAAVAPERVQQSLGNLQAGLVEGVMTLGRYRQIPVIARLRMQWDAANYRWHKAVIGFDRSAQGDLLDNLLGGVSPLKMVLVVIVGGGVLVALMTLHLWWLTRPERKSPALRYYTQFEQLLGRRGWVRKDGETAGDFCSRILAGTVDTTVGVSTAVLSTTALSAARLPTTRLSTTRLSTTTLPTARLSTTTLPTARLSTTTLPTARLEASPKLSGVAGEALGDSADSAHIPAGQHKLASAVTQFTRMFEGHLYGGETVVPAQWDEALRQVKQALKQTER